MQSYLIIVTCRHKETLLKFYTIPAFSKPFVIRTFLSSIISRVLMTQCVWISVTTEVRWSLTSEGVRYRSQNLHQFSLHTNRETDPSIYCKVKGWNLSIKHDSTNRGWFYSPSTVKTAWGFDATLHPHMLFFTKYYY